MSIEFIILVVHTIDNVKYEYIFHLNELHKLNAKLDQKLNDLNIFFQFETIDEKIQLLNKFTKENHLLKKETRYVKKTISEAKKENN